MITYSKIKEWVKQHRILIIRILISFIFFLFPFSTLIPLSAVQPPKLKINAYPPGYPVEGQTWTVEVWISQEDWLTWKPVPNATLIMHASLQGDLMQTTDSNGKAIFMYTSTLGSVNFEASFNKLNSAWAPQQKFVSNAIAFLFVGIFGIGGTSFFWQTVSVYLKHEKRDLIGRILSWILAILTTAGFILCFIWLYTWKLGTEWGFGDRIISLNDFSIAFDPHLFFITLGVFVTTSLIWIKKFFLDNWKDREKIHPDYIR